MTLDFLILASLIILLIFILVLFLSSFIVDVDADVVLRDIDMKNDIIESKVDEKISVEHLSSRFAVGRRNFDRRFIKATGNTPVEYSQRVKIEAAKKAFETSRKTINEVMYEVGYSDNKAFREVFRKITGMSPIEYKGKYNKEALTG